MGLRQTWLGSTLGSWGLSRLARRLNLGETASVVLTTGTQHDLSIHLQWLQERGSIFSIGDPESGRSGRTFGTTYLNVRLRTGVLKYVTLRCLSL